MYVCMYVGDKQAADMLRFNVFFKSNLKNLRSNLKSNIDHCSLKQVSKSAEIAT